MLRTALLLTCMAVIMNFATAKESAATNTWCAQVLQDVPDGFLNLRAGPSTVFPVLARLRPAEYIEIDTGGGEVFSKSWIVVGTVVAPTEPWAFVEHIPRLGGGREHGGWINTHFVQQIVCDE